MRACTTLQVVISHTTSGWVVPSTCLQPLILGSPEAEAELFCTTQTSQEGVIGSLVADPPHVNCMHIAVILFIPPNTKSQTATLHSRPTAPPRASHTLPLFASGQHVCCSHPHGQGSGLVCYRSWPGLQLILLGLLPHTSACRVHLHQVSAGNEKGLQAN